MTRVLHITGPLNFDTVPAVSKDIHGRIQGADTVCIDCGGVTQCNSAALALFIEWIQQAGRLGIKLTFSGIPEHLMKIAATCGIRHFFEGGL